MRISDWSSDVCSSDLLRIWRAGTPQIRISCPRSETDEPDHRSQRKIWICAGRAGRFLHAALSPPAADRQQIVDRSGSARLGRRHGERARAWRRLHALWRSLHYAMRDGSCACRRSEEHTSELQSLMRISYAVFCLKKKINNNPHHKTTF